MAKLINFDDMKRKKDESKVPIPWTKKIKELSFQSKSIDEKMKYIHEHLIKEEYHEDQEDQGIYHKIFRVAYGDHPHFLQLRSIVHVENGTISGVFITDDGVIDDQLRIYGIFELSDKYDHAFFEQSYNHMIYTMDHVPDDDNIITIAKLYLHILDMELPNWEEEHLLPHDAIEVLYSFLEEKDQLEEQIEMKLGVEDEQSKENLIDLFGKYMFLCGVEHALQMMDIPLHDDESMISMSHWFEF